MTQLSSLISLCPAAYSPEMHAPMAVGGCIWQRLVLLVSAASGRIRYYCVAHRPSFLASLCLKCNPVWQYSKNYWTDLLLIFQCKIILNRYCTSFLFFLLHLSCLLKQTKTRPWLIVSYNIAFCMPLSSKCRCCVVKCNPLTWTC